MQLRSQVLAIILFLSLSTAMPVFAKTYGYGSYGDGTYGDPLQPAGSIDNGPGLPVPQAKSCDASKPTSAPVLFQITPGKISQTLYFTPATNADRYFIEYGSKSNSYPYGFEITNDGKGVIAVTINALQTNTSYYYKVRGGNGCAPGDWSNELSAKTGARASTYRLTSLTAPVRTQVQKTIASKTVIPTKVDAPMATLAPGANLIPSATLAPVAPPKVTTPVVLPTLPTATAETGFWAFIKRLFAR